METDRELLELAAKAMQAMISGHLAHYGHAYPWPAEDIARHAFEVADAMRAAASARAIGSEQ